MKYFIFALLFILTFNSQATPSTVFLIRHAEKPDYKSVDLSHKGYQRAEALTQLFEIHPELSIPSALYAANFVEGQSSKRPIETLTPLAKKLNLALQSPFVTEDYASLAQLILNDSNLNGKTVMIAWTHTYISMLAEALGVQNAPTWHGSVFNKIWVIQYQNGAATLTEVSQKVLPDDN